MAVRMIPVYECDECEFTTEDADEIRFLEGTISNGSGKKIFLDASEKKIMLCVNCMCELLGVDTTLTNINLRNPEIEIKEETQEPIEEIKEEPVIEEKKSIKLDLKDSGKFLVLCQIDNEEKEKAYAEMHGIELKTLRENYGSSLQGLYVKTGDYFIDDAPKNTDIELKECSIVNKMLCGVPNIIKRQICVSHNGTIGYITPMHFDLQIQKIDSKIHKVEEYKIEEIKVEEPKIENTQEIVEEEIFEDEETSDTLDSIINASIDQNPNKNYTNKFSDDDI